MGHYTFRDPLSGLGTPSLPEGVTKEQLIEALTACGLSAVGTAITSSSGSATLNAVADCLWEQLWVVIDANPNRDLILEGITAGVINTGDIMFDAVLRNIPISERKYSEGRWKKEVSVDNQSAASLKEKEFYLATIHRAENTDDKKKLADIFAALGRLDKPVLMPLHPRTRNIIRNLNISTSNVIIVQPVGYLLMLYLTANAYMILTDSGGIQKEAYFLKVPCTTLRDQTEWVETLKDDWNVLSRIAVAEILDKANRKLSCRTHPQQQVFGDGHAAENICREILRGDKKL